MVVGAGSAGCVLSRQPVCFRQTLRVCLLEAGPDRSGFWIKTPLGYGHSIVNDAVNWMYASEPEAGLGGRTVPVPRGRIVGGSSAINAMVYMRGTKSRLRRLGRRKVCPDWALGQGSRQLQDRSKITVLATHLARYRTDHCRSPAGRVSRTRSAMHFWKPASSLQIPLNDDFNGESVDGLGYYHHTICSSAKRMSAARAWLDPARRRAELSDLESGCPGGAARGKLTGPCLVWSIGRTIA